MATIQNSRISKLKALLIDDMSSMRVNLRTQLQQLGVGDVAQAASAAEALKAMSVRAGSRPFDLVLCDYNLGGGTNGQQLLEHVRAKKLLLPVTIWFMITADSSYDSVAVAGDYAPDDYLIKPFTAANLESRLMRHFERQDALEPALKKMSGGDIEGAVIEFSRIAGAGTKFTMDALRLKARCLTDLHRHGEAKEVYAQALWIRQRLPWAELGFARALHAAGEMEKAHAAAVAMVAGNPTLVGAHELMAEIHHARGEDAQAVESLRTAESIVPSAERARALGEMAVRSGNLEVAKTAYAKVVAATRNSVTRTPYDNSALAQVYMETGEPAKALEVLKPAQQEFAAEPGFQAVAAAVEARAQQDSGNEEAASAALARALDFAKNADAEASLAVSRACFALGEEAEGERLVTRAVRSDHEDVKLVAAARKLLKDTGREDAAGRVIDEQVQDMLGMTEKALELAKQARLGEARAVIAEAVAGLPRNIGVLIAAAQIHILYLSQKGLDIEVLTRAQTYLAKLETLAHGNERVVKMRAYLKELLRQAGAGTGA